MFIDYYELLEISENSSNDEIKAAFHKEAIRWHPDKNPNIDTTTQMQRINEAYLILKDLDARKKYDIEYQYFKSFKNKEPIYYQKNSYSYENYNFYDDILRKWMNNARNQSVNLATQTIKEFKELVSVGSKEAIKASGHAFIGQLILSIIIIVIISFSKSCS